MSENSAAQSEAARHVAVSKWPDVQNLRSWLALLEENGELGDVKSTISPDGVLATILRHGDGQRAVRFLDVAGSDFPVVGNLVHHRDHLAAAMGCETSAVARRYLTALESPRPFHRVDAGEAPVLECRAPEGILSRLPIGRQHERDAGPYITAALLSVRDPSTGVTNLSINRMQAVGPSELRACVLPNRLLEILAAAEAEERALDVAIVIGVDPLLVLASQAPADLGLDDLELASALRRTPLAVVQAPQVDALVPADAEIVIEGRFRPKVRADEGPFGEFPLTYAPMVPGPVIDVVGGWHRSSPVFQTILSGGREHYLVGGVPNEAELLRGLKRAKVDVIQVRLTEASSCRLTAVISVRNSRAGSARSAIVATWGTNPSIKNVIVVDDDVDIFDDEQVGWAFATRVQADRDLIVMSGVRGSSVDPSTAEGLTAKLGIDATAPLQGRERFARIKNVVPAAQLLETYLHEAGVSTCGTQFQAADIPASNS